jgi:predicted dehydrogenase
MKRCVIVGTGGRGALSYLGPLSSEFKGRVELVGLYDPNPKRMHAANTLMGTNVPEFNDFEEMMRTTDPDGVIVTSQDSTHAEYVVSALERDCETIVEKPLCTTAQQVRDIRRAAEQSAATGRVTHNMRFTPDCEVLKREILDGRIGDVLHINFVETLDRSHGADYFRRWHRFIENSGGLMIHKASHHFDMINWLADSTPETVVALGRQSFYGKKGPFHGERCSNCEHAEECNFYVDMFAEERIRILYRETESEDGYMRDGCVFDPRIDIPDTFSASIAYGNGIIANYALTGYSAYESAVISVEGTRGRLEMRHVYTTGFVAGQQTQNVAQLVNDPEFGIGRKVTLYLPHEGEVLDLTHTDVEGSHGGADPKMLEFLFGDAAGDDPLNQYAPLEQGVQAVLVGLAVNESIENGGAPVAVRSIA